MGGILSIKIRADATPFERSLKTVGRNITSFAQKSLAVGRGISLGFTAPLMAIGSTAVRAAADFDGLERALQGIMGGANAAAGEMGLRPDFGRYSSCRLSKTWTVCRPEEPE